LPSVETLKNMGS